MAIVTRKFETGSVRYQVKLRDPDGNWYPMKNFLTLEDAKEEEARLLKLKRKGGKAISEDARAVTLDEYWEVWSVENRENVSAGWRNSQDQMYRAYVKPVLGDRKMIEIGTPEIGKALKRVSDLGRSPQTHQHVYNLLHRMFRDAVEYYEMLAASPVKPKHHRRKVIKRKRAFLEPDDAWKLMNHVRDQYYGPAIWLQLLSGLRVGEVQALRWKSLFFDRQQILICSIFNKKTGVLQDYPKQEDWAYSPMPDDLRDYLLRLAREPEDWVVPGPRGGMLKYDTYREALVRACQEVGVIELETHELRHSCTEIWQLGGANTEDLRRLLNQKSLTSTRAYIHRTDERLNVIAKGIRNPLGSTVPRNVPSLGTKERGLLQEGEDLVH